MRSLFFASIFAFPVILSAWHGSLQPFADVRVDTFSIKTPLSQMRARHVETVEIGLRGYSDLIYDLFAFGEGRYGFVERGKFKIDDRKGSYTVSPHMGGRTYDITALVGYRFFTGSWMIAPLAGCSFYHNTYRGRETISLRNQFRGPWLGIGSHTTIIPCLRLSLAARYGWFNYKGHGDFTSVLYIDEKEDQRIYTFSQKGTGHGPLIRAELDTYLGKRFYAGILAEYRYFRVGRGYETVHGYNPVYEQGALVAQQQIGDTSGYPRINFETWLFDVHVGYVF